jgi:hypothetical protein
VHRCRRAESGGIRTLLDRPGKRGARQARPRALRRRKRRP